MLFSGIIFAENNPVTVNITNATGTDCVLEKQTVLYGYISDPITIPNVIFSDQSIEFTMKSNKNKRKSILLAYACGDDRSATFFTDITYVQHQSFSKGFGLKSHKIHLYFTEERNKTHNNIYDTSPVKVNWRLTR